MTGRVLRFSRPNSGSSHPTLRRSALLLTLAALAVLAGATLALIPRPAEAVHAVWSATLTPQSISGDLGCWDSSSGNRLCSNALSDNTIELQDGTSIQIFGMRAEDHNTHWGFQFETLNNIPAKLRNYALEIGGLTFRFDASGIFTNNRTRQWGLQSDVGTRNLFTAGTAIKINLVDTRVTHAVPVVDEAEIGRSFAKAQPKTAWSATLRVQNILTGTIVGCQDDAHGSNTCTTGLTDNDFTDDGTDYEVTLVQVQTRSLSFGLDKVLTADLIKSHRLIVNGKPYHLANASVAAQQNTGDLVEWSMHGQEWAVGDRVRVKLVERDFPTLTAQPFDHSVDPLPASERRPTRSTEGVAEQYCYTGDGNAGHAGDGTPHSKTTGTTMIRYADGRIAEVPNPGATVRTMYACN